MSASDTSLSKRLLSGVAIAVIALVIAACSDEKKEAASTTPAETATSADATTTASTAEAPAASTETKPAAGTEVAQASTPAAEVELPKSEGSVDVQKLMEPGPLPEMALGKADAPVTIVEYMSMTCPHCAAFHNNT
ncbi:MAG TPA: thioredoxin domain-containing protein, partial [Sinorhizobium sp.]|nr:thioredoxin domain-containing protein [Sinorhizobium sp.]